MGDEPEVIDLWRDCGLVVPWNDPHRDVLRKSRFQPDLFLVGELSGKIVATVMAGYDGHRGWIHYIGVRPSARRRGYASAIMTAAEERLIRLGCPKINLQVRSTNTEVIAFYEAVGYRMDDVLSMGKRLVRDDQPAAEPDVDVSGEGAGPTGEGAATGGAAGTARSERPDWDSYFMEIAAVVASRSTCDRAKVGAVIVRDKRILTTGFNGSPSGQPHCDEVGHLMIGGHCARTIHAELNAIIQGALHGISLRDATAYVTHFPCLGCAKALANVGLARLVYGQPYRDHDHALQVLMAAGILVDRWHDGSEG